MKSIPVCIIPIHAAAYIDIDASASRLRLQPARSFASFAILRCSRPFPLLSRQTHVLGYASGDNPFLFDRGLNKHVAANVDRSVLRQTFIHACIPPAWCGCEYLRHEFDHLVVTSTPHLDNIHVYIDISTWHKTMHSSGVFYIQTYIDYMGRFFFQLYEFSEPEKQVSNLGGLQRKVQIQVVCSGFLSLRTHTHGCGNDSQLPRMSFIYT